MNTTSDVKPRSDNLASNVAYLLYSLACYVIFLATFLYLIGFLGKLLVPKNIDSGESPNLTLAILIDIALVTLFAIQHSVMARKSFKAKLTHLMPRAMERATYVLFSSLTLILLFYFWQPIAISVWSVESPMLRPLLSGLFWVGWGIVLLATFLISHFELFGVKQTIRAFQQAQPETLSFITPSLYKIVRHPMYLGFLITFWATPDMTVGHLVFALTSTTYIFIGTHLEEKDLVRVFGSKYLAYQQRVGMLLPSRKKLHSAESQENQG